MFSEPTLNLSTHVIYTKYYLSSETSPNTTAWSIIEMLEISRNFWAIMSKQFLSSQGICVMVAHIIYNYVKSIYFHKTI